MAEDEAGSDDGEDTQDTGTDQADEDDGARSFKWPDIPRITFGPGLDHLLDARLDWVRSADDGGSDYYINAYRAAIDVIYKSAASRMMVVEHAIFPLAFLWRHQLELLLKGVITDGRALFCEPSLPIKGHNLVQLWDRATPYIEPLGPRNAPELKNAEATINDFQRIDPRADGFRYPHSLDGFQRNLQTAPAQVNIVVLHDAMLALTNFLGGVRGELGHRLSFFLEHESEFGRGASDEDRAKARRQYMEVHNRRRT